MSSQHVECIQMLNDDKYCTLIIHNESKDQLYK